MARSGNVPILDPQKERTLAIATVKLKSFSPYSQSNYFESEKKQSESHDERERRCWREKMHVEEGEVVIPLGQFKAALDEAAARLGTIKIDKKGLKNFIEPGIVIAEHVKIGVKAEDVKCERVMCNADGQPSKYSKSGKVPRLFPLIPSWTGTLKITVLDGRINEEHIRACLKEAGLFVGIGRWRAGNRGQYGRFLVEKMTWEEKF